MRGRWTVNLLLLILVAGLSTAVHIDLERELEAGTLTGLTGSDIAEVVLDRPGNPTITLTRTRGGWRMQAPYEAAADGERVDQLVRIASTPVHRTLPAPADLKRLGLDPPGTRLTLNGLELRFGDLDPIGRRRYLAIGDRVHLIDDGFQHHLIARPEDYVDRRLLPAEFHPQGGNLEGEPLPAQALEELGGLTAERVEPLGDEISGRLISLVSGDGGQALRFLLSEDGRAWTRLDLRLTYLFADPPFWAVGEDNPQSDTAARAQPVRPE
jgi:hypothetical protein